MVNARRLLVPLALISLSACATVGPNYRVPDEALVNAPKGQGAFISGGHGTTNDPLPDQWWKLFDDQVLNRLIEQALIANTDLRVAEANLQRSDALLAEARTGREVGGTANLETSWAQPSAEAVMQHVQPPEHQIYNGGLSVSYDLDLFGGIRRGVEAATAEDEVAVAARDLVRINVAAQTAQAYADACNAGHEIADLRQLIAILEEDLRFTRLMIAHGRAPKFELDRQLSLLANTRSRLPRMEAGQRNAAFRIATLIGQVPAEYDRGLLGCHAPLVLRTLMPVGDGQGLLKRRPEIRAAERLEDKEYAARQAHKIQEVADQAARAARLGSVADAPTAAALTCRWSCTTRGSSTGAAADLLSSLTNRFGIGPLISWNIHRSTIRARISQSEAQTRANLAAFDGTVLSALREVESALNNYAADLVRLEDLKAARDGAVQVSERTAALRRGGKLGGLVALDAQRSRIIAEQAVTAAQTDINRDQIALFLALGGGWSTPSKQ